MSSYQISEIAGFTENFLTRYNIPFDKVEYSEYNYEISFNNKTYCGRTIEEYEHFYLQDFKKEIRKYKLENYFKSKKYYLNYIKNDLRITDVVEIKIQVNNYIFTVDICLIKENNKPHFFFNHKQVIEFIHENWNEHYINYQRREKFKGDWLNEPNGKLI